MWLIHIISYAHSSVTNTSNQVSSNRVIVVLPRGTNHFDLFATPIVGRDPTIVHPSFISTYACTYSSGTSHPSCQTKLIQVHVKSTRVRVQLSPYMFLSSQVNPCICVINVSSNLYCQCCLCRAIYTSRSPILISSYKCTIWQFWLSDNFIHYAILIVGHEPTVAQLRCCTNLSSHEFKDFDIYNVLNCMFRTCDVCMKCIFCSYMVRSINNKISQSKY